MMKHSTRVASLFAGFLFALLTLRAHGVPQDIDLYTTPPNEGDRPNVLFIIDNDSNWNTNDQGWESGKQGQEQLQAVMEVVRDAVGSDMNVGVMMLTSGGTSGGFVRFHITDMDADGKNALVNLFGNDVCTEAPNALSGTANCLVKNYNRTMTANDNPQTGNGVTVPAAQTNLSYAMYEAYRYFKGLSRFAGAPNPYTDPRAFGNARLTAPENITGNYVSPVGAGTCPKNFIILIGNRRPAQDDDLGAVLKTLWPSARELPMPALDKSAPQATWIELDGSPSACGAAIGSMTLEQCKAQLVAANAANPYEDYKCEAVAPNVCTTGGATTTPLACGTSLSACQTAASSVGGTCINSGNTCTTTESPAGGGSFLVTSDTGCIDAANASRCVTAAREMADNGVAPYAGYASFSCQDSPNVTNCKGGKRWQVTAGQRFVDLPIYAVQTTVAAAAGVSYRLFGQKTFSQPVVKNGEAWRPEYSANVGWLDEWAKFLRESDFSNADGLQNVKTYTIDVRAKWTGQAMYNASGIQQANAGDDYTFSSLLMSTANAGGGKYFNVQNKTQLKRALEQVFSEIQSVNSVFASSSLPVSVNSQGTYLNQVFIGMFRPTLEPRWPGNLKQYQLGFSGTELKLKDATYDPNDLTAAVGTGDALSSEDGFISPCARSFWTRDTGSYWNYDGSVTIGECLDLGSSTLYSDAPDGNVVEKGSVAQTLRGTHLSGGAIARPSRYEECTSGTTPETADCRKLLTLNADGLLVEFNSTNVTALDADTVAWVRGKDVDNENKNYQADGTTPVTEEMRPSVHGGVVHSQPAAIDYGDGNGGVVVFYGSDDGVYRAINGTKSDDPADNGGKELWGFVPPEFIPSMNRLRGNSPMLALPPEPSGSAEKEYFFDGSTAVYQNGTTVRIYATQRRGGRMIYAFNVDNPRAPSLVWRRGCPTASMADVGCVTGGQADWTTLGQTWSKPVVTKIEGYDDPVIVFGGGYNTCEDTESGTPCTAGGKGAAVFFVNALTGNILRVYPTTDSVPGEVAVVKSVEGYARVVYAADTGGHVYRIDVGRYDAAQTPVFINWTEAPDGVQLAAGHTKIASLSTSGHRRKFIFGPDVMEFLGNYYVSVGSGDREKPLAESFGCLPASKVEDYFFIIKDTPGSVRTTIAFDDAGARRWVSITENPSASVLEDPTIAGWKLRLNDSCEKTVNRAISIGGKIFFSTNQPNVDSNPCVSNLGKGFSYIIDIGNLSFRRNEIPEGGLAPSPVAGMVQLEGGKTVPFCIGCGGEGGPLEAGKINVTPPPNRSRVFWYMRNN